MTPTFQLHGLPIYIGALKETFHAWFETQHYSSVFVVADEHTQRDCLPVFLEETGINPLPYVAVIAPGEDQKNLATCEKIWLAMLQEQLDRKTLVVNIGGGVIGDMGGFCAATWKRGVDFIQIPTTLLAMTDAAIGGKTGIDFQGVKNILGAFRQPAAVFIDPVFLRTLPSRELKSGLAEVIKHSLIGDERLWLHLQKNELPDLTNTAQWLELLRASIAVKVRVVSEDPYEKGLRMLLNFGHTIGHALESYFLGTGQALTHGEAVAIGMVCELPPSPLRDALLELISRIYPLRIIPRGAYEALWSLMLQDKKNSGGQVRMALPGEAPFSLKPEELGESVFAERMDAYNQAVEI